MTYRHYQIGNTKKIETSTGGSITGRDDVVFLRNKYQALVDDKMTETWNMVHYIEDVEQRLRFADQEVNRLAADVLGEIDLEEKMLNRLDTHHENVRSDEKEGWAATTDVLKEQAKQPINVVAGTPIFGGGVGTVVQTPHIQIPRRYEDGAFKDQERKLSDDIKTVRYNIGKKRIEYLKAVREFAYLRQDCNRKLLKAEENLKKYEELVEEGTFKISQCRYVRSIFYNVSSEQNKELLRIDVTRHDVNKIRAVISALHATIDAYPEPPKIKGERGYEMFKSRSENENPR